MLLQTVMLLLLTACSGTEEAPLPPVTDRDADGWPAAVDCDDSNRDVGPAQDWFPDVDGDGFGDTSAAQSACTAAAPAGHIAQGGDCNDEDAAIHPDAPEIDHDGVDQNCDGADVGVRGSTHDTGQDDTGEG